MSRIASFVTALFVASTICTPVGAQSTALAASPTPPASAAPIAPPAAADVFSPPQGWTPVPPYFVPQSVQWLPAGGSKTGMITVTRMPMTTTPRMRDALVRMLPTLTRSFVDSHGKSAANLHVISSKATLCGSPGQILTTHLNKLASSAQTFLEWNDGTSYFINYTYSGKPSQEQYVRSLCPKASVALADLTPPPGWSARESFRPVEMWYGPTLGEMLVESRGPEGKDLATLLQLASKGSASRSARVARAGAGAKFESHSVTQTCGAPAIEATFSLSTTLATSQGDILVVQGPQASYSLVYSGQNDARPSAALIAAMHDFCPA